MARFEITTKRGPAHCADNPKLFMWGANPKEIVAIVPLMVNEPPRKKDGKVLSAKIDAKFFGRAALRACRLLKKGSAVNIDGAYYNSFMKKLAVVGPDGKAIVQELPAAIVSGWNLGPKTQSERDMEAQLNINEFMAGKNAGTINPDAQLTGTIVAKSRPLPVHADLDMNKVKQTGLYFNATVWVKGQEWVGPQTAKKDAQPATAANAVAVGANDLASWKAQQKALQDKIAQAEIQAAATAKAAAVSVDPLACAGILLV